MGKKGNESKARRKESKSDSEKWISMLSIYWWEISVTMLSNNIDSLHYRLPQIPVWTGKLSERTPQNHHIKLPVHLMCCWKKVPWCAVHCRLSSCSDLCPVGESHEFSLLLHVAKRFEKEYQSWSLGFWLWAHFLIFSPLYNFLVESNSCCWRNLGVWGIQFCIKPSAHQLDNAHGFRMFIAHTTIQTLRRALTA